MPSHADAASVALYGTRSFGVYNFDGSISPDRMSADSCPPGRSEVRQKLCQIAGVIHPTRNAPDPVLRPRARTAAPDFTILKIAVDGPHQTGPLRKRLKI